MRRSRQAGPGFGSDSFLDIVANLVGVLIILVILVGIRVKQAPLETFFHAIGSGEKDPLEPIRSQVQQMGQQREQINRRSAKEQRQLDTWKQALGVRRDQLRQLTELSDQLRARVAAERASLEPGEQQLTDARSRLVGLRRELEELEESVPQPAQLVHRNPLSRPVESREAHFELQSGRIAFIDVRGLVDRAKGMSRRFESQLRRIGSASGVTDPVGEFQLKFTMMRDEMPFSESLMYRTGSFRARLVQWQLVPVSEQRGEPIQTALLPGSKLWTVLKRFPKNRYAVTLWIYPESFAEFRQLRDLLHHAGYAVAARPLPEGTQIAGSVYGTKSRIQ